MELRQHSPGSGMGEGWREREAGAAGWWEAEQESRMEWPHFPSRTRALCVTVHSGQGTFGPKNHLMPPLT